MAQCPADGKAPATPELASGYSAEAEHPATLHAAPRGTAEPKWGQDAIGLAEGSEVRYRDKNYERGERVQSKGT